MPTLLLLIGYPVYWIELYFFSHPTGHSTWLASGLLAVAICCLLYCKRPSVSFPIENKFLWVACAFALVIMAVAGVASTLPPHLAQEYDAINYHITIPRQHLLTGSFAHLTWSLADLFLLPVNFALAPFWLVTELPNKWPQFLFFLSLPFIVGSLTRKLGGDTLQAWMAGLLVVGAHGISIQAGTAMLDVALCYLFVAALDSFLGGYVVLAAIEIAFFVFAKPAFPLLCFALTFGLAIFWLAAFRSGVLTKWCWGFLPDQNKAPKGEIKKFLLAFLCASIVIGGPFMLKSFYYTGTPFCPLGVGFFSPLAAQTKSVRDEIKYRSDLHLVPKDGYGFTRTLKNFIIHFWWITVPEEGVNNRFDYPLGLSLLLVLVPFIYFLTLSLRNRIFSILPLLCVVYWVLWWYGMQQSRFLFVPMVLMIVTTVVACKRLSKVLWACVVIALGFTALSVYRAHASDFGKTGFQVLRAYDARLLKMGKAIGPGEKAEVDSPDAAFAPFIVDVKKENGFFVLKP
ncbi:MAG: hypothetical protein HQL17_07475 [Candidatus Omnitrophica bacterium]|nr:hypothetical protein [Candidatus Omnitrophota bacterium]